MRMPGGGRERCRGALPPLTSAPPLFDEAGDFSLDCAQAQRRGLHRAALANGFARVALASEGARSRASKASALRLGRPGGRLGSSFTRASDFVAEIVDLRAAFCQ